MILTNFLSPTVYELINECSTFENAVTVLKSAYVKCTHEVFSRHLLSIRKQQPGESLDEFLQVLKTLSKDCNFESVTAEQHKNEYIRDSFISGLQSNSIRQRFRGPTLNFKKLAMKLCHFLLKNYDKLCKIEEKLC